jgi:hypothetical protein
MNLSVWVRMQAFDVLQTLDYLLPNLITEKDFEQSRRTKLRHRQGYRRSDLSRSYRRLVGGLLVAWGMAMLAPGPVDVWLAKKGASVGFVLGSPFGPAGQLAGGVIGAVVFVASYNLFALAVFTLGTYLVITG